MTPVHYAVQHQLSNLFPKLYRREEIDSSIQIREKQLPLNLVAEYCNPNIMDSYLSITKFTIINHDRHRSSALNEALKQNNLYLIRAQVKRSDISLPAQV